MARGFNPTYRGKITSVGPQGWQNVELSCPPDPSLKTVLFGGLGSIENGKVGDEVDCQYIRTASAGYWKGTVVPPPPPRMTVEQYTARMNEILSCLPEEFRGVVLSYSYDRSHSSGYEEVVSTADDLASQLLGPIAAWMANHQRMK